MELLYLEKRIDFHWYMLRCSIQNNLMPTDLCVWNKKENVALTTNVHIIYVCMAWYDVVYVYEVCTYTYMQHITKGKKGLTASQNEFGECANVQMTCGNQKHGKRIARCGHFHIFVERA